MPSVNQVIRSLITKHQNNTPAFISQLLSLLPTFNNHERKVAQTAILFAMQSLHEWQNVAFYIEKWQHYDFRKQFIRRMKKRVDQNPIHDINTKQQMTKAIDKYWAIIQPKKQQHKYHDPESVQIIHQVNESSHQSKVVSDTPQFKLARKSENQKQPQPTQSQTISHQVSRKTQGYSTLTGRPAILKKTSLLDLKKKLQANQNKNLEKTQSEKNLFKASQQNQPLTKIPEQPKLKPADSISQKASSVSSHTTHPVPQFNKRISNIKMIAEMVNNKNNQNNNTTSFDKNTSQEIPQQSESIPPKKGDQPYPQNFKFGSSNKKQKPIEERRRSVSPIRKLQYSNKRVVIRRQVTEQDPVNKIDDFSFMESGIKPKKTHNFKPSQPEISQKPAKQPAFSFTTQKITKNPYLTEDQARNIAAMNSNVHTPIFKTVEQPQFLSKQEMKLVNPEYKPLYVIPKLLAARGIDVGSIVQEGLQKWKKERLPFNPKRKPY